MLEWAGIQQQQALGFPELTIIQKVHLSASPAVNPPYYDSGVVFCLSIVLFGVMASDVLSIIPKP